MQHHMVHQCETVSMNSATIWLPWYTIDKNEPHNNPDEMLDKNYDQAGARKFIILAKHQQHWQYIGNALEQSAVEIHEEDDDRLASLFKVRIML